MIMLGTVNATSEGKTGWRFSHPMPKTSWRLNGFVTKLSSSLKGSGRRSTKSSDSSTIRKKQVRFAETNPIKHSHPYSQSYLEEHDLWYTTEDCKDMLWRDVNELVEAGVTINSPEARGLELYVVSDDEYALRKSAMNQYIRAIVQMSRENNSFYTKALRKTSRRKQEEINDYIRQKSLEVTELNKDHAFGLACGDEFEARNIYMEVNPVVESAARAPKSKAALAA